DTSLSQAGQFGGILCPLIDLTSWELRSPDRALHRKLTASELLCGRSHRWRPPFYVDVIPRRWRGKKFLPPEPENSVSLTNIVDEGLFTVVALRKHRQQSKATKASATNKAASVNIPPEKKTSRVSW
ncbi:hypothetical protein MRX96_055264, partial [Rhipicephalus microplus]